MVSKFVLRISIRKEVSVPNIDSKKEIGLKGLGSIRGYFGLNILGKLNTFVYLVLYLNNLNVIACF